MEYLSITEAARRLQVSDKTIQRAIHAGKLPARYPKKNLAEIAVADLEAWRSASLMPTPEEMQQQIAELQQRVTDLERITTTLQEHITKLEKAQQPSVVSAPAPAQSTPSHQRPLTARLIENPPLIEGRVILKDFADLHGMSRNESERLYKTGSIKGYREPLSEAFERPGRRRPVRITIDAQGKHDFWVQFHDTPGFRACDDCPHDLHK